MPPLPDPNPPSSSTARQIIASLLHVDIARFEPIAALRCALGVGMPLSIALALHQPGAAVFLAVGAVSGGFGSFQGAYRSRAATMIAAATGMAISICVGSLIGASALLATATAAIWGFAAGLLVAISPSAGFIGLHSAVAVLVAAAYPSDPAGAAGRGLLVLIGGFTQTVFVVAVWPLRRFHVERAVVSGIYRSLADYARQIAQSAPLPPDPQVFVDAATVHDDPHPFARPDETLVFQALLDEAERLRTSLAALSVAPREHTDLGDHVSTLLTAIASAVAEGRAPSASPREWDALTAASAMWRQRGLPIDTLLGQLRAAWRTAAVPSIAPTDSEVRAVRKIRTVLPIRDTLMTLRANLSLGSTACRHGLRLAVALAFATATYRAFEIPRGYWFAMTTLIVLKPQFRETFVTGAARIVGTLLGAGLATLLVAALGTHHAVLTILLLGFVWSGYALFRANYVIFTIAITGYVVLLLTLAGVTGATAAWYRVLDTALGGALGLTVYALWPTWEAAHAPIALATLIELLGGDAHRLFGMYATPAKWDPGVLADSRAAARLARSNAEASIERMLGEPAAARRFDAQNAVGILAACRRYALAALALHARLDERPSRAYPELEVFGDHIARSLDALAHALRDGGPVPALPLLRDAEVAIESAAPELAAEIDMMVDSVNTIAALIAKPRMLRRSASS